MKIFIKNLKFNSTIIPPSIPMLLLTSVFLNVFSNLASSFFKNSTSILKNFTISDYGIIYN